MLNAAVGVAPSMDGSSVAAERSSRNDHVPDGPALEPGRRVDGRGAEATDDAACSCVSREAAGDRERSKTDARFPEGRRSGRGLPRGRVVEERARRPAVHEIGGARVPDRQGGRRKERRGGDERQRQADLVERSHDGGGQ